MLAYQRVSMAMQQEPIEDGTDSIYFWPKTCEIPIDQFFTVPEKHQKTHHKKIIVAWDSHGRMKAGKLKMAIWGIHPIDTAPLVIAET